MSGCIHQAVDEIAEEEISGQKIHEIEMRDFKFVPASLEVETGDYVKFINSDRYTHNVKGDIELGLFAPGEFKTTKITESGEISYTCTIHSDMNGLIISSS